MTFSERERLIFHIAGLVIAHAKNKWDLSFCPRCEKGKLFRDGEIGDVLAAIQVYLRTILVLIITTQ